MRFKLIAVHLFIFSIVSFGGFISTSSIAYETKTDYREEYPFSIQGMLKDFINLIRTQQSVDENWINNVLRDQAFDLSLEDEVRTIVERWSAGTIAAGTIRINQPRRAGAIHFYLIEKDYLEKNAPRFICGCRYIPSQNTIICDSDFLKDIRLFLNNDLSSTNTDGTSDNLDSKTLDMSKDVLEYVEKMFEQFMLQWVIAHELGHAVLQHDKSDLQTTWKLENGMLVGLDAERSADEFFVSKLQHQPLLQFHTWLSLSNVVTKLYSQQVKSQHKDKEITRQDIFGTKYEIHLPYSSKSHPPFIIRAINMSNVVIDKYPQMNDTTGYFNRILKQIVFEKSENPIYPSFCRSVVKKSYPISFEIFRRKLDQFIFSNEIELANGLLNRIEDQNIFSDGPSANYIAGVKQIYFQALNNQNISFDILSKVSNHTEKYFLKLHALGLSIGKQQRTQKESMMLVENLVAELKTVLSKKNSQVSESELIATAYLTIVRLLFEHFENLSNQEMTILHSTLRWIIETPGIPSGIRKFLFIYLEEQYNAEALAAGQSFTPRLNSRGIFLLSTLYAACGQQNWLIPELEYGIALAKLIQASPEPNLKYLFVLEQQIAKKLKIIGDFNSSALLLKEALSTYNQIKKENFSENELSQLVRAKLILLNNLGHSYYWSDQYEKSLQILTRAEKEWNTILKDTKPCSKDNLDKKEHATVQQNLADTFLALGKTKQAIEFAQKARLCRSDAKLNIFKLTEADKTMGFAFYHLGNIEKAKKILSGYVNTIMNKIDDTSIHWTLGSAIVNGKRTYIDDIIPPIELTKILLLDSQVTFLRKEKK